MSVCGSCPYPYEAILENPELTEEEVCGVWCSYEDAADRAQWAYDQLYARYKELEKRYNDSLLRKQFNVKNNKEEFLDRIKKVWPDIDIKCVKEGEGGIVFSNGDFIPANQVFQYLFGDIV